MSRQSTRRLVEISKTIQKPKDVSIVVPYVPGMLHPLTEKWASEWAQARLVELDPNDDTSYYELLAEEWRKPGMLIVVEQDIVPGKRTLEYFLRCGHFWCVSPYLIANGTLLNYGLGCVRFSDGLKKKWPGLMNRVGYLDDGGVPAKTWRRLDVRVAQVLQQLEHNPHQHGQSLHLHDYRKNP